MRALKILISIFFLLIGVIALAIGALYLFVDPNQMKPAIAKTVLEKTGYQVVIDGPLTWAFYPRLAIKTDHLLFVSPHEPKPFLEMHDVKIDMAMSQALHPNDTMGWDVYVEHLTLMNVRLEQVSMHLQWDKDVLKVNPIKAVLYGGQLEGRGDGQQVNSMPVFNLDIKIMNIEMRPFLDAIHGTDSKLSLSGSGNLSLQGTTEGKDRNEWLNRLKGTAQFTISNGSLEGVDVNFYVHSVDALIQGQPLPPENGANQTDFSHLTGIAVIQHGIAQTDGIDLIANSFTAKARGSVALLSEAINLQLQVKPLLTIAVPIEIPVTITGDVRHPDIRLDKVEIQRLLATLEIENLKQKASQQIQKHIHGKPGEILQKLLGQ